MNKKMMRMPIVILWSSAAILALKLLKVHMIRHGLFDSMINLFTQIKVVTAITVLSAMLYEAIQLVNFINFGDDDSGKDNE